VVRLVRHEFDYSLGNLQILLSGSYGSAKSILMAHLCITHCLQNPGARACIARRALPDLKRTILKEILEHIENDLVEGTDYVYNRSESVIRFRNGSEIICMTWADKRYKKGRSLRLSFLLVEEIVENSLEDKEAFDTLIARLRRIPHVKENVLIAATNPDSPGHWVYKHFIDPNIAKKFPNRYVFYSLTEQNPFLDKVYIEELKSGMSKKEADRYLRGQWIELRSNYIYYAYERDYNYRDYSYRVDPTYPICWSFDFNIGEGKPLSSVFFQFINDEVHIFNEVVVDGFRTRDNIEDAQSKGLLDYKTKYYIHGDASGKSRNTRSNKSDYDIINDYLSNEVDIKFDIMVPLANPPVRKRHNIVNAYCCNDLGKRRLFVYKDAPTADEGLRLAKLKKGAQYIEDDSDRFQHITTAIGYGIIRQLQNLNKRTMQSGTM
jgi:PBSX family phage terminase large subunit